jgi:uncharacterized membrane protein
LIAQSVTTGVLRDINGKGNAAKAYAAGLIQSAGMLILSLALASDPNSAGPITAVLPLDALLVSLLAWALVKEKLTRWQLIGIVIVVCGPIAMALADTTSSALKGVAYGAVAACLLGVSNFLRRLALLHGAKNPTDVQLLAWFAVASCGAISMIGMYTSRRGLRGLDSPKVVAAAAVSGLIWAAGGLCFQMALQGPVGPASAIANINGEGVLLLQIVIYQPHIRPLKYLGMGICLVGASIISLSPKPKTQNSSQLEMHCSGSAPFATGDEP